MSLKLALVAYQQEKKDKEITEKIEAMLAQQQALLAVADNEKSKTSSQPKNSKPSKEWQPDILTKGGISYYTLNGKKYKVSVCDGDNDVVLKFTIKDAMGRWVSVSARSLKEAQSVVDDIFGKYKYTVSACRV